MKKIILFLFIFSSWAGFSQEDAWVYFADKPNSASYLSNPLTMLTQRSLDRRTAQNIPLAATDVPIHQPYIDQVTAATGITVMAKSKWLNCLHVRGTQIDITALQSLPFVSQIKFANALLNLKTKNVVRQIKAVNKQLSVQINYNYGNSLNQVQMMKVDWLHQQGKIGTGKVIAILDAGFPGVDSAQPFQNLVNNNHILGGYDFVNKNANFYTGDDHGTMVLSTIGGFTDGQLVGSAPDAKFYLYITEDVASENPIEESNWVEAAEEADRVGVDIITTSLGYFAFDDTAYGHTYSDMTGDSAFASRGANIAFTKGIIVVASAGNEGNKPEPHIGVPAEALKVLAVGAVKSNRSIASFSSIGPSFDGRIKPDVCAQGQASVISDTTGNITTANGTSFSCPIMAGSIASFWQAFPTLTNQQIVDAVKQSADKFSNPDNQYGFGIPNFQAAYNSVLLSVNTNESNAFQLYPNPTNDTITLLLPKGISEGSFILFNALGQKVFEENISCSKATFTLNSIEKGIYFYKIDCGTAATSGKVIKN